MSPVRSLLPLAICAALLSACGDGSNDAGNASANDDTTPLAVGDHYATLFSVDDEPVSANTFQIYGVSHDGRLTVDPAAKLLTDAMIHVPAETFDAQTDQVTGSSVGIDQLGPFVQAFWQALSVKLGVANPEAIWQEIKDQDVPFTEMYTNFTGSGLTMAQWVDFYTQLDDADIPAQTADQQEAELGVWLHTMNATPATLLQALADQGTDWPGFLATLQARQWGFSNLNQKWLETGATNMASFIAQLSQGNARSMATKAAPLTTQVAMAAYSADNNTPTALLADSKIPAGWSHSLFRSGPIWYNTTPLGQEFGLPMAAEQTMAARNPEDGYTLAIPKGAKHVVKTASSSVCRIKGRTSVKGQVADIFFNTFTKCIYGVRGTMKVKVEAYFTSDGMIPFARVTGPGNDSEAKFTMPQGVELEPRTDTPSFFLQGWRKWDDGDVHMNIRIGREHNYVKITVKDHPLHVWD